MYNCFCSKRSKTSNSRNKKKTPASVLKSQDEDAQMMTEVDLFISTKAVKVLNADTQVSVTVSSSTPSTSPVRSLHVHAVTSAVASLV